jgi:hypothetical protein
MGIWEVEAAVKVKEMSDLKERRSLRYQMTQGTKGNPVEGSGSPEEQRRLENPRIIERSEGNQIWRGRFSLFDLPGLSRVSSRVQANEQPKRAMGDFPEVAQRSMGLARLKVPAWKSWKRKKRRE